MGYDQYTVPDTVAVERTVSAFLKHSQTYVHGLSCHSFKFLQRTVNSKPPTIPFGIVHFFFDNLSRNSCGRFQLFLLQWRIQGRAPLFLDQTETRTAEKKFFETPPPPYLRAWMTGLPPYLKVWIRHCSVKQFLDSYNYHVGFSSENKNLLEKNLNILKLL